jgi:hypothetical protein
MVAHQSGGHRGALRVAVPQLPAHVEAVGGIAGSAPVTPPARAAAKKPGTGPVVPGRC